jgi:hypothetical protein
MLELPNLTSSIILAHFSVHLEGGLLPCIPSTHPLPLHPLLLDLLILKIGHKFLQPIGAQIHAGMVHILCNLVSRIEEDHRKGSFIFDSQHFYDLQAVLIAGDQD